MFQKNLKWVPIEYMIHLLSAIGLTPGGSSTVHIYTQTIHRITQDNYTQSIAASAWFFVNETN